MAAKLGTLTAINTYTSKCRVSNTMRNFTVMVTGTLSAGTVIPQYSLKAVPNEANDNDWVGLTAISTAPGATTANAAAYWVRAKADGSFVGSAVVLLQETTGTPGI